MKKVNTKMVKNDNRIAEKSAQHGDVILKKIESLPEGSKKTISKNNIILAGSTSPGSNTHSISSNGSKLHEYGDGMRVLELKSSATLTHKEHKPITLAAGFWQVGAVQEFDYFAKIKRAVVD